MSSSSDKSINIAEWPKNGTILLVGNFTEQTTAIQIAIHAAETILSENSPRSQLLFRSQSHPDLKIVHPENEEKESSRIKIDQIRELIIWASGKPQISDKKIALIYPAHMLNLQAANALLKTLEEPLPNTIFILITDKPALLLPTIRSRCYWIRLKQHTKNNLLNETDRINQNNQSNQFNEIDECREKLLKDLQELRNDRSDPILVSEQWIKESPKQVLNTFITFLNEQLTREALQGKMITEPQWWQFLDNLQQAIRSLEEPNPPNLQLLMDTLLIEYYQKQHLFC